MVHARTMRFSANEFVNYAKVDFRDHGLIIDRIIVLITLSLSCLFRLSFCSSSFFEESTLVLMCTINLTDYDLPAALQR